MSSYRKIASAATAATSTTLTTTALASAGVGELVVIGVSAAAASSVTKTFADSAGNTWTKDDDVTSANNTETSAIFRSVLTAPIVAGVTTFTVTWGSTIVNRSMSGIACANPLSASPLDFVQHATVTGGTTISTPTQAPATADELAFVVMYTNAGVTVTKQSGWDEVDLLSTGGTFESQALLVTSTSPAIGGAATTSATGRKVMCCALYKLSPPPLWAAVV